MDITEQIPTTDEDFVKNEDPSKNSTKIIVDMEKNAPFIKELQQKIAACSDPEAAKKMEDDFQKATGVSFDDALKALENGTVVEIENADGSITLEKTPSEETSKPKVVEEDDDDEESVCESCNIFGGEGEAEDAVESEKPRKRGENLGIVDECAFHKDEESATVNAAEESEAVETGEEVVDPEELKLRAEVLSKLDTYLKDPSKLKIGIESVDTIAKTGVFGDRETVQTMIDLLNQDIDELIDHENPESRYHDPNDYAEAVQKCLEIKISMDNATTAAAEITDPAFIMEIFNQKYPEYVAEGPSNILNKFVNYLNERTKSDRDIEFLCKELTDKKKIDNIVKNANDNIFRTLVAQNGQKFTLTQFVQTMFVINRDYFKAMTNCEKKEDVTYQMVQSPMSIFAMLFLRYIYKFEVDNMASRKLQRKYFIGFMFDITNPAHLDDTKRKALDDAWISVWNKITSIEQKLIAYEVQKGLN